MGPSGDQVIFWIGGLGVEWKKPSENQNFNVFWGTKWEPKGAKWGPSKDQLRPSGDQMGPRGDQVGPKWGPSGYQVGTKWDQVGTKWFFGSEVSAFNGKTPARIKKLKFVESEVSAFNGKNPARIKILTIFGEPSGTK